MLIRKNAEGYLSLIPSSILYTVKLESSIFKTGRVHNKLKKTMLVLGKNEAAR